MKFLDLDTVVRLNQRMAELYSANQVIRGRVEAFSCLSRHRPPRRRRRSAAPFLTFPPFFDR